MSNQKKERQHAKMGAGRGGEHPSSKFTSEKKVVESSVNMLKTGQGANYQIIWPRLSTLAMAEFGRAAQCMEEGKEYRYPDPNPNDFMVEAPVLYAIGDPDPDNDKVKMNDARVKALNQNIRQVYDLQKTMADTKIAEATKTVMKAKAKMEESYPRLFAFIIGHMSTDSQETVKTQEDWDEVRRNKDPVGLVKLIQATHRTNNSAYMDATQTKYAARKIFEGTRKRDHEGIGAYNQRFIDNLEQAKNAGNPEPPMEDLVQNFIGGLDNRTYAEYKASVTNNVAQGMREYPKDLNAAYREVVQYTVTTAKLRTNNAGAGRGGATAFVSNSQRKNSTKVRNGNKTNNKDASSKDESGKDDDKKSGRGKCFRCGEYGHYVANCPQDPGDSSGSDTHHTTTGTAFVCQQRTTAPHEVLLDNQSEVSAVHSMLCTDFRDMLTRSVLNIAGRAITITREGYMPYFGWVWVSDDLPANLLSFAAVEDMYDIDRVPGESFTVHLPDARELVFERRGRFYVGDCSDWCSQEQLRSYTVTVEQLEGALTKAERAGLHKAREFIARAGFPGEKMAVDLILSGNLSTDYGISAADIRNAFRIPDNPHALRGKATAKKVKRMPVDDALVDTSKKQEVQTDIIHFMDRKYLFSHLNPLRLMLLKPVARLDTETLGRGLEEHISVIKAHGYGISRILMEPTQAVQAMVGSTGDTVLQPVGAGEHLDALDRGARSLKEIARATRSAMKAPLVKTLVDDLMIFSLTRLNSWPSSAKMSMVSPKTEFTGRKAHKRDFAGGFCDYVEFYVGTTNSPMIDRTQPGVLLYPMHNSSGSWKILNLRTKRRVISSNFKVLPMTQEVIDQISALDEAAPEEQDEGGDATDAAQPARAAEGLRPVDEIEQPIVVEQEEPEDDEVDADDNDDTAIEQFFQNSDEPAPQESASPGPAPPPDPPVGEGGQARRVLPERATRGIPAEKLSYMVDGRRRDQAWGKGKGRAFHSVDSGHIPAREGVRRWGKRALAAMEKEFASILDDKKAAHPVRKAELSKTQRKKILRSLLFFKEKYKQGEFEKLKARLVANGAQQDKQLYLDNSSPTATLAGVLLVLALAAKEGREVGVADIGTAYLNADIGDEEIYIEVDQFVTSYLQKYKPEMQPFVDDTGRLVLKLEKALYGCIQSARLWYSTLSTFLESLGYKRNTMDNCVFNSTYDGQQVTVVIYVDDLLITCKDRKGITSLIDQLNKEYQQVKFEMGKSLSYLGIHVSLEKLGIRLSMEAYVDSVLEAHPPIGKARRRYGSPGGENFFETSDGSPPLEKQRAERFHTIVAKLLYVSMRVLPHISVAVSFLTTRVSAPTQEDEAKLERVLGYLSTVKGQGVLLPRSGVIRLRAWIDAAFALHHSGASHSGCVIMLDNAAVSWGSTKQKIAARNSTESELVSLSDKMDGVLWAHDFLVSQGYTPDPPIVYQDNQSTIHIVTTGGGKGGRTRHLRARQGAVKELSDNDDIVVQYCCTEGMLADALTKPLASGRHAILVRSITHDGPPLV